MVSIHAKLTWLLGTAILLGTLGPAAAQTTQPKGKKMPERTSESLSQATFGSGCFWCTEAIFRRLKGVHSVVSGYTGGQTLNPTYKEVCSGTTGHAEVIQIDYDPNEISFAELLEVFWKTHDPTTLNQQGNDIGTQYRSAVFYHDAAQRQEAEKIKSELNAAGVFPNPIVTEITEFTKFYPAEDYHQEYFELNGREPYCSYVIKPKVEKLQKYFRGKLQKPVKEQE